MTLACLHTVISASFGSHEDEANPAAKCFQLELSSMAEKSKILIIGATGYIGKFLVQGSVKGGHPTFALVRESAASNPEKAKLIESFRNCGVTLLYGNIQDHENLVKAIKQVDVVISAVGGQQVADQVKIIAASKEAGNVKRFLPSEFGQDVDRHHAVEPAASVLKLKAKIRRVVEAEGIPYTYIISNAFSGRILPSLGLPNATVPPRDKVLVLGDGNTKAVFVMEDDIATYTIRAVDDPRTLKKSLYLRPPANVLSFNEIISLWEKKIGKSLERIYVTEDQILKDIQESSFPWNYRLAIRHSLPVKGDGTNFEIGSYFGLEASELYSDVKYSTVDEYMNQFV